MQMLTDEILAPLSVKQDRRIAGLTPISGDYKNTVKTHSSRLFDKLSAKRRTQAVQRGKELGLIP